jgi:acyl-ACP thioesterase
MQFKTTSSMIDINNHVHNPAYLEYVRAILPDELVRNTYDSLEVEYRAEVKPDEVVTIEYREVEGKHIVSVLDAEGHTHATIALAHKLESEA